MYHAQLNYWSTRMLNSIYRQNFKAPHVVPRIVSWINAGRCIDKGESSGPVARCARSSLLSGRWNSRNSSSSPLYAHVGPTLVIKSRLPLNRCRYIQMVQMSCTNDFCRCLNFVIQLPFNIDTFCCPIKRRDYMMPLIIGDICFDEPVMATRTAGVKSDESCAVVAAHVENNKRDGRIHSDPT